MNPLPSATWSALLLGVYVTVGVVYALHAHWKGLDPSDPDVVGGSWGFRAVVTPGLVALWPLLLRRGLSAAPEDLPHDRAARQ